MYDIFIVHDVFIIHCQDSWYIFKKSSVIPQLYLANIYLLIIMSICAIIRKCETKQILQQYSKTSEEWGICSFYKRLLYVYCNSIFLINKFAPAKVLFIQHTCSIQYIECTIYATCKIYTKNNSIVIQSVIYIEYLNLLMQV